MKKLLALALVLSLCAVGVFAQPTVNGDLSAIYKFQGDPSVSSANLGRVRLAIGIPVGDFVKVNMDLRDDTTGDLIMAFNQIYAVTNVSKAFGLDAVALTLTGGNFEYWIANFNAATTQHRTRAVENFAIGGGVNALALDAGFDFGTILTYVGFPAADEITYKFGFKLGPVVEGLNAALSYSGGTKTAVDYSYLKVEAGYALAIGDGMTLTIPGSFLANLETEVNQWDAGVKFVGMGLTAAVEVGSKNIENDFLQAIDFQVKYDVAKELQVFANGYMDASETYSGDFFEAVDLGVRVTMGANKLFVGYVIDAGAAQAIAVTEDDSAARAGVTGGGLYLAWRVTF